MNADEARARVAAQDAKLVALQAEIARLGSVHAKVVLFAMLRALVEMACGAQGPNFLVHNKIRFYEGVLQMLRSKGIS